MPNDRLIPAVLTPVSGSDDNRSIIVEIDYIDGKLVDEHKIDLEANEHSAVFFSVPSYAQKLIKEKYGVDIGDAVSYSDKTGVLIPVTEDQIDTYMSL